MSLVEICLLASLLVVVVVVAKMLRAVRLLDGRMTLLQEQLKLGRVAAPKARNSQPAPTRSSPVRTPVFGVPVAPPSPRAPTPAPEAESAAEEGHHPGEQTAHVIGQAEADAVWAHMEAEQERLKKAMGRDFQVRTRKRSASDIRGKPVVRALSAQDLAKKIERK
ncbi:MAG: hypothetical protein JXP73_05030 [Deltaproteobacteria bacterium]|jgi:hypothetical protein|nr:hypothetical protein [Deltaproteobacteria bacterium]